MTFKDRVVERDRAGVRILYVAGAGRSGSTLIAQALCSVSTFTHVGEVIRLSTRGVKENELCGCGNPFQDCAFWMSVVERLPFLVGDTAYDRNIRRATRLRVGLCLLVSPRRTLSAVGSREFSAQLSSVYQAIRDSCEPGQVIVDSSKSIPYLLLLMLTTNAEISVVHVVRDPRSVAMSWLRKKRRLEVVGSVEMMATKSPVSSGTTWMLKNMMAEAVRLRFRRLAFRRVRYEDFVSDPNLWISMIADDVGFRQSSGRVQSKTESEKISIPVTHTVSGNPMRFISGDLEIDVDSSWADALSRAQNVAVSIVTFPLLVAYRYLGI